MDSTSCLFTVFLTQEKNKDYVWIRKAQIYFLAMCYFCTEQQC